MKRWPLIAAVGLAILFATYFSWFDITRHAKTNSTRFDLGNMEQVVWNVSHGHGFTLTDPYGSTEVSRFAFHADVFLILIAPIYALIPRTETLLILQVLVVASGGLAVFFLGRKYLPSERWAVLMTLLFVLNPAVQWATIFDFHPVTLATGIILWAVVAAVNKKYWWTLALVIAAMTTKEEIGLSLAVIGIFVWWRQHNKKWGVTLTVVPLLWSLFMLFIVLPHFRHLSTGEVYQTVFGSGARSIIGGAIRHPLKFAHQLFSHQNLVMAWQLLVPLGFLSLGSLWTLGAVPDYGVNALSLKPAQHLVISHYTSGLTPWLFVGAILTLGWLLSLIKRKITLAHDLRTLIFAVRFWMIGWLAFGVWSTGPLPGAKHDDSPVAIWRNDYAAPIAAWAKKIPTSAAVSVTNDVGTHFARRERLYSFPYGLTKADYVVILEHHATPVVADDSQVSAIAALQRANTAYWEILEHTGDLTILKKR